MNQSLTMEELREQVATMRGALVDASDELTDLLARLPHMPNTPEGVIERLEQSKRDIDYVLSTTSTR